MPPSTLTDRQAEILSCVREFIASHGYAPSVRDIAAKFGMSAAAAHEHLYALAKKGAVSWTPKVARSIRVL